ncbi:hypothetical protein FRAHR75_540026 [Frankia sp. Hr75.2]|nr:hypothetical protein FRAHR75_540026 [Frankia sp. Hr75.2]
MPAIAGTGGLPHPARSGRYSGPDPRVWEMYAGGTRPGVPTPYYGPRALPRVIAKSCLCWCGEWP